MGAKRRRVQPAPAWRDPTLTLSEPNEHAGYEVIAAYVADRKKTEFESRKRIEDRGAAIVATSSGLLALIFLLTVVVTGKENDAGKFTSQCATLVVLCALAAFIVAAALGIFVQNSAWRYEAATNATLREAVKQNAIWNGPHRDAARVCADLDIDSIASLRRGTQTKAIIATVGLVVQGLALMLIVVALGIEFAARGSL